MPRLILSHALLPEGWAEEVLVVTDAAGRIEAVHPGATDPSAQREIGIGIPGLPNLHSHAFQRGMAGLSEHAGSAEDSFWTWREVMYRFLARLTPDDVEAIATLAYAEMLEAGFTRVGEFHYLHHDADGRHHADIAEMAVRIAAAASATGINLTLLPCFYAHGEVGGGAPDPGQRRFLSDRDSYAALVAGSRRAIAGLPGARLGIAPHSLRAATAGEIRDVMSLAAPDEPLHIHVSEQVKEVEACEAILGRPPIAALDEAVGLSPRWCLIHATHGTSDELRRVAASGAVVGLCPITESNLGDGIFPARGFTGQGGRFGVGTDSNILISAPEELRVLEYAQRLIERRRNVLAPRGASTARTLWEAALAGGTQALGAGPAGLVPGAWLDLVVLDPHHPALAARQGDRWLDALLFAAPHAPIRSVIVRGQAVVTDGVHPLRAQAEARVGRILARILGD